MDIDNFPKYCYSMRVDNSHNLVVENKITDFCSKHGFTSYLLARENKDDGTPHYQGCLWTNLEITKKKELALRQQILRKLVFKFHPRGNYSFKIARSPKGLAKYCNDKEGNGVITNLSTEKRELLGKWKIQETKTEKKTKKRALLNAALEDLQKHAYTREGFFHKSIEAYTEIYDNLPRAGQVEYWVYKYASDAKQRLDMRIRKYQVIRAILHDNELAAEEALIPYASKDDQHNIKLNVTDYAIY